MEGTAPVIEDKHGAGAGGQRAGVVRAVHGGDGPVRRQLLSLMGIRGGSGRAGAAVPRDARRRIRGDLRRERRHLLRAQPGRLAPTDVRTGLGERAQPRTGLAVRGDPRAGGARRGAGHGHHGLGRSGGHPRLPAPRVARGTPHRLLGRERLNGRGHSVAPIGWRSAPSTPASSPVSTQAGTAVRTRHDRGRCSAGRSGAAPVRAAARTTTAAAPGHGGAAPGYAGAQRGTR